MSWTKEEVDRVLVDILRRAQRDPAYRTLCLEDPPAAVKAVTDRPLPPGYKLRFVDNDRANLTVVLPDLVEGAGRELSDDELSTVSGGIQMGTTAVPQKELQPGFNSPLMPGACFAARTPVLMADGTWQPIEAVTAGAGVMAFDEGTQRVVLTRVSESLHHNPEPVFAARIDGLDGELFVTPNHPFYVNGQWRRIGNLPLNSELAFFDRMSGQSVRRLLAFEPTGRVEPVYNFEVDEAHSYFVDGVLVHNGSMGRK